MGEIPIKYREVVIVDYDQRCYLVNELRRIQQICASVDDSALRIAPTFALQIQKKKKQKLKYSNYLSDSLVSLESIKRF